MTGNEEYYRALYRIRRFEEIVIDNFAKGVFGGTTHTYLGQEANAVGVLVHLQEGDVVFSNHRCHGHFLAYGGDPRSLFAELMGKANGVCGGRGGSQHLQWKNFYSNGVQGGILPLAAGMALAEKRKGSGAIAICFMGDGTLGEGLVYETLNMAALWTAPVLFVVENNQIAQTTPVEMAISGVIGDRFTAFGIPISELDSSDINEISEVAGNKMSAVRRTGTPHALVLHTCRFGPHSKGDDTRPQDQVAVMRRQRDPVTIQGIKLSQEKRIGIETQVEVEIEACYQKALEDPLPEAGDYLRIDDESFSADKPRDFQNRWSRVTPTISSLSDPQLKTAGDSTVLASLNTGLNDIMKADDRVILLGEDIVDPYGGAFKVTRGLSTAYPDRVIPSPISEAGLVGVAAGMALRGLRPVVEIMFGDFLTLAADQLVNHAAKFRWMYNDQVRVPLVIRTPMGGRRGYGPTHSQTLEKIFLGVPGLKVVAPCALGDPGGLLTAAIQAEDPILFIENKQLYTVQLQDGESLDDFDLERAESANASPVYRLKIKGAPAPDLTLVTYGYMAELARQAVSHLGYEEEIFLEVLVFTQLSPFHLAPMMASAGATGRLMSVEEGTLTLGWGAEVISQAAEELGPQLKAAGRVAAHDLPVPASPVLEAGILPGVADICAKARAMIAPTAG